MLEYAANGQHYWSEGELGRHAAETVGGSESLSRWIRDNSSSFLGIEDFFRAAEANLRESRMRLIFFLEESRYELRSLVDFLNRQLAATEVLLVEARLYQGPVGRIVVPWLFGYTEQARLAKRDSKAEVERQSADRGEAAYLRAIAQLDASVGAVIHTLIDAFPHSPTAAPAYWSWGVNAILILPSLLQSRGLFSVLRNGDIELYFGYWTENDRGDVGPAQLEVAKQLADGIEAIVGIAFTPRQRQKFPRVKLAQWAPHAEKVLELLRKIAAASPQANEGG